MYYDELFNGGPPESAVLSFCYSTSDLAAKSTPVSETATSLALGLFGNSCRPWLFLKAVIDVCYDEKAAL
jgi:hypothetical protein